MTITQPSLTNVMANFNGLVDPTDFGTVASYLKHPESRINYVLHTRTRDFLSPLADYLLEELYGDIFTPSELNAQINCFASEIKFRISTRYAAPEIAAGNYVWASDIALTARSWNLCLPPFCFTHTRGLFEVETTGTMARPRPTLPEHPVKFAQTMEFNLTPPSTANTHHTNLRIQYGTVVDIVDHFSHPGSPISYVLHVRSRELLVPTAQHLQNELNNPPRSTHLYRQYLSRLLERLDLVLSPRNRGFEIDARRIIPISVIPRVANSTFLYERPFCIAHTPGLFEGRLIHPRIFVPPVPRRSTGIKI